MTKTHKIIFTAALLAGLAGFFAVFYLVLSDSITAFDDYIRYGFYSIRTPALSAFVSKFTLMGNWQFITLTCIVLLIIKPTRTKYGIPLSIGAILVSLLNKLIKHLVLRPRPDQIYHIIVQGGYSFPSGHSIISMFSFGLLLWLINRNVAEKKLRIVLSAVMIFLMFGIGLSRIYCGVHYPSDVLAGWCLGISALSAEILIISSIEKKSGERKS
ncbi:MAG: phosphatase PAP2 family protein [Lentihominibacter sp.]